MFTAPEILEAKEYDGKADIWSVGCIFYEMLIGQGPFKGSKSEADLLNNIRTKELTVPKNISEASVSLLIKVRVLKWLSYFFYNVDLISTPTVDVLTPKIKWRLVILLLFFFPVSLFFLFYSIFYCFFLQLLRLYSCSCWKETHTSD